MKKNSSISVGKRIYKEDLYVMNKNNKKVLMSMIYVPDYQLLLANKFEYALYFFDEQKHQIIYVESHKEIKEMFDAKILDMAEVKTLYKQFKSMDKNDKLKKLINKLEDSDFAVVPELAAIQELFDLEYRSKAKNSSLIQE